MKGKSFTIGLKSLKPDSLNIIVYILLTKHNFIVYFLLQPSTYKPSQWPPLTMSTRRNVLLASKLSKKHKNLLNVSHVANGFMLCLHAQSHSTPAWITTIDLCQHCIANSLPFQSLDDLRIPIYCLKQNQYQWRRNG